MIQASEMHRSNDARRKPAQAETSPGCSELGIQTSNISRGSPWHSMIGRGGPGATNMDLRVTLGLTMPRSTAIQ